MEDGRVENPVFVMKKQHVRSKYLADFPPGTEGVKQVGFNRQYKYLEHSYFCLCRMNAFSLSLAEGDRGAGTVP